MELQGFDEGRSGVFRGTHAQDTLDAFIQPGHVLDGDEREVAHAFAEVYLIPFHFLLLFSSTTLALRLLLALVRIVLGCLALLLIRMHQGLKANDIAHNIPLKLGTTIDLMFYLIAEDLECV